MNSNLSSRNAELIKGKEIFFSFENVLIKSRIGDPIHNIKDK